jgi:hypothetical protein
MEDVVIGIILKNSNGDTITFTRSELLQLKSQLDSLFSDKSELRQLKSQLGSSGVVRPVIVPIQAPHIPDPYPTVTYW